MRVFTPLRYFSLLSFILVVIAGSVLGVLVHQQQITQMELATQERSVSTTHLLRTLLAQELQNLINTPPRPSDTTGVDPNLKALHVKLTTLAHESGIYRLKLFNRQGIVLFSTLASQIGESKSSNAGFMSALNGQVASELTYRNEISRFDQSANEIALVSSYVPIRDQDQIVAVFEVYQDVTTLDQHLHATRWQIVGGVSAVLGMLYLLLLLVVRHVQKQLLEKESMLEAVNRALDQRVHERTEALQHSEARFRSLTEMSSDFYWETDKHHRFTQHNPLQNVASQSLASAESTTWQNHPPAMALHQLFRAFEIKQVDAEGNTRDFSVSGDPQFNALGQFTGYLGVGTDITQDKQAQAELRIAAVAFEAQEAMMVTDAHCVILRINQAFTKITGYSTQEVLGQTPRLLSSSRHDNEFYRAMWDSIHRTGGWKGEIWDRRKSGDVYPTWLNISAVKDADGQVTHYIGTHYDISERKEIEEKIRELAFHDSLTRLPNRALFRDRLKQAMAVSTRNLSYGGLLFIDLDHFKALNDTLGHDRGDMLLQQVAERLSANVREGDTVARLGGDEFVVVLKNLGQNFLEVVNLTKVIGEKILTTLSQPYPLGDLLHHNTASVGATVFDGQETSVDDLLKQADLAMYQSKDSGRNVLHFFDPDMQKIHIERAALEADLRRALQDHQLVLHYQPQVSGSGQTAGAEALVRWQHPLRGLVSPAEFIPLAEQTSLILPLGLWVLETACAQLAQWAQVSALAQLTLAVNVSARQFRQADFVEQVLSTLAHTGADPRLLKLELTESLLVDDMDDVIAKMRALKAQGVCFSLDDFGTGYSSLAYLSQLPLEQLKIDRSFVKDIESSDNAVAICAATISLAHSLKLKVVAEGVETLAQHYFLSTVHRCDFLQGYFFSRPLPVDAFEIFVTQHAQASQRKRPSSEKPASMG